MCNIDKWSEVTFLPVSKTCTKTHKKKLKPQKVRQIRLFTVFFYLCTRQLLFLNNIIRRCLWSCFVSLSSNCFFLKYLFCNHDTATLVSFSHIILWLALMDVTLVWGVCVIVLKILFKMFLFCFKSDATIGIGVWCGLVSEMMNDKKD